MEPEDAVRSQPERKPIRYWVRFLVGLALVLFLWALSAALDNARILQLALTIAGATGVISLARLIARWRKR
jgi:hypothetical protein